MVGWPRPTSTRGSGGRGQPGLDWRMAEHGWQLLSTLSLLLSTFVGSLKNAAQSSGARSTNSALFMSASSKPRGSAATPLDKKSIAVFGGGGSLGGTIFGYLQRASNLYGTGIGGAAMPRNICACSEGSLRLNSILSKGFKLAFAGEQHMRLVDMSDVEHVAERLKGVDAVVVGTVCQLEPGRAVTGNTYEKTPNDKTTEFFLDEKRGFGDEMSAQEVGEQLDVHLNLFQTAIDACKLAGSVKHVVVLETPYTPSTEPFAKILDNSGLKFTYIYTNASAGGSEGPLPQWIQCKDWTFERGVQNIDGMSLESAALGGNYLSKPGYDAGDWASSLPELKRDNADIYREDIAALAVQSMLSLDWDTSRVIGLSCSGKDDEEEGDSGSAGRFRPSKPPKSDREWCMKSKLVADLLSVVN
mmetsp:Transcript_13521/g.22506  ORF Transcript_13521/g.22506 Transcript_13521/m.22506 type:complete len:415 (-) Transcript_13521:33-1277(-)